MGEPIEYVNAGIADAYRDSGWGHTDGRCEHALPSRHGIARRCGLPAWDGAPDGLARCEFHSDASPDRARERLTRCVSLGADLSEASLHDADLSHADVPRALLSGARLTDVDLSHARLHGADLAGARLHAGNLTGAQLSRATLAGAAMPRARLGGAHLWRADLAGAQLMEAELTGANLDSADLSGARLVGARLTSATLRGARLGVLWSTSGDGRGLRAHPTDLRGADLRGAALEGATIAPETVLDGARLGREAGCEFETRIRGDDPNVYRQLKLAFQQAGDYQHAGEYYYQERRALHGRLRATAGAAVRASARTSLRQAGLALTGLWHVLFRRPARWRGAVAAWWRLGRPWRRGLGGAAQQVSRLTAEWVIEKLCGYGERPMRVAAAAAVVVVLCAVAQWHLGLIVHGSHVNSLWTALYHSAVTFSTLGYGDAAPSPGLGRFLASVEALVGAALASLFLVCVVRKFSR